MATVDLKLGGTLLYSFIIDSSCQTATRYKQTPIRNSNRKNLGIDINCYNYRTSQLRPDRVCKDYFRQWNTDCKFMFNVFVAIVFAN